MSADMRPVGWGLVGLGAHADARLAPAIAGGAGSSLVSVCSSDPGRAADFARKHGARRWTTSPADLAADPEVEVVCVASDHGRHIEHAMAALAAGKPVLCEKPVAPTARESRALADAFAARGIPLGVAYNQRFHPGHERARQLVQESLGELVLVRAEVSAQADPARRAQQAWRAEGTAMGGALKNTGPHAIDLLRFVTGREVVSCAAIPDDDGELVVAALELEGGLYGQFVTSRRMPYRRSGIQVHGTDGWIGTDGTVTYGVAGSLEWRSAAGTELLQWDPAREPTEFDLEIAVISDCVRNGTPWPTNGDDGWKCMVVLDALAEACATGQRVTVPYESA